MWKRLDFNGNNIVSLAEVQTTGPCVISGPCLVMHGKVDKLVNEQFPLLNHKPALMRAFQATLRGGKTPILGLQCTELACLNRLVVTRGNGDEWVQKHEFKMLLGVALRAGWTSWLDSCQVMAWLVAFEACLCLSLS